jgi:hypothetical protein
VIVEHYPINAFDPKLDQSMKLAIARDLQRMWSGVLQEPLPTTSAANREVGAGHRWRVSRWSFTECVTGHVW